jgi:hypothetical protein
LVKTAGFDGKSLLKGVDMDVQVGLNVTDKLKIKVNDIDGKLFRSSIVTTINLWIAEDYTRCRYYNSESEMKRDLERNLNLVLVAIKQNGSGTGGQFRIADLATAIVSLRDKNPSLSSLLNDTLPETISSLKSIIPHDNNRNFANATINQLAEALVKIPGQDGAKKEVMDLLGLRGVPISLYTTKHAFLSNIYVTALATIRAEQARVANQKQNLLFVADALRAATNITQKAADSYLKTDYVLTAQLYSETIRTMVAAITSLQAANKIPEAAQRLIDALAK